MKSFPELKIIFCLFPFLLTFRSVAFFSTRRMEIEDSLKIINAYLEKDYLPPRENVTCYRSSDLIKVNDTLVWRKCRNSEKIMDILNKNKIRIVENPVILSESYSRFPDFFKNRVELVNTNDHEDWCGIYSFSPAYKTIHANEYIIQIFFDSYEEDYGTTLLIEFCNNRYFLKEELDGWTKFF